MMHRTHMGVDQDAENILDQAMRTALGDGWGGSMLATDISDILFGTPSPLQSQVNLGVLKDDQVNIIVHGHEPTLSEMIVAASTDPELLGLCRVQGRQGHQPGGHLLHGQRSADAPRHPAGGQLPLAGAGHRHRALSRRWSWMCSASCRPWPTWPQSYHTKLITTSPKAKIEARCTSSSTSTMPTIVPKQIVRTAIDNYPNRGKTHIPADQGGAGRRVLARVHRLYAGRLVPQLLPPAERCGDRRAHPWPGGRGGLQQCPRTPRTAATNKIVRELIKNDVLVVVTGCAATAAAKDGYLRPEFMAQAGPGLREVCEAIGIPPRAARGLLRG